MSNNQTTLSVGDLLTHIELFVQGLELTSSEDANKLHLRKVAYIKSLVPQLDSNAKLYVEALLGKEALWFRPDWTPESFTKETEGFTDAERCEVALLTRDIPLISWFVNARAGRPYRDFAVRADLESQRRINESEVEEIAEALETLDSDKFLDALSDTLLTTCGFGGYLPIALTQNFVEMVDANFTRIAGTREEAEATQKHWSDKGVPCRVHETEMGTYPVLVTETVEVNGDKYPAGKFLKKVGFRDAVPSQPYAC